eukprot:4692133-Karenia_brevis.AAC.1
MPVKGTDGSAGYGIHVVEQTTIPPLDRGFIKTGSKIEIPFGTYARLAPRSGLALKQKIYGGVVDFDYTGDVGVILHNHSSQVFHVNVGDRICQTILERIDTSKPEW